MSNLTKFINRIQVDFKVKRKEKINGTIIVDKLLWPILKCTVKSEIISNILLCEEIEQ